jgi:hypothetical protein
MLLPDQKMLRQYEKALVDSVRDVVSEFLLIDPAQLICCVGSRLANPAGALIDSAIELYFAPGSLKFSNCGAADISWSGSMKVSLDFEFSHDDVRIYFTVALQPRLATIQINYLWLGEDEVTLLLDQRVKRLASALANARLRPVTNKLAWWRDKDRPAMTPGAALGER